MPREKYSNLTVAEDVKQEILKLKEELRYKSVSDVLRFLIFMYRYSTNLVQVLGNITQYTPSTRTTPVQFSYPPSTGTRQDVLGAPSTGTTQVHAQYKSSTSTRQNVPDKPSTGTSQGLPQSQPSTGTTQPTQYQPSTGTSQAEETQYTPSTGTGWTKASKVYKSRKYEKYDKGDKSQKERKVRKYKKYGKLSKLEQRIVDLLWEKGEGSLLSRELLAYLRDEGYSDYSIKKAAKKLKEKGIIEAYMVGSEEIISLTEDYRAMLEEKSKKKEKK